MKQSVYFLLVTIILAGCGKKESSGDSVTAPAVNSEMVQVTQVVGTGLVEPEEGIINLAAATGGIVKEVVKRAGDQVRKNEPVIKLDDETDQIGIKQLMTQIRSQTEQTRLAALNLQDARIKLARKSGLLKSTRELLGKGAETSVNFDDLDAEVKSLILDTLKAAATLDLEKSRLDGARENLRLSRANAEKKVLTSPYDGMLLNLDVEKGSSVSQFSTYAELAPSGPEIVKAEVDELFADRLKTGQDAEIRYIGSDSAIATGKLYFVSPYLTRKSLFSGKTGEQEDRMVRQVKIALSSTADIILNSRVECVIKVK